MKSLHFMAASSKHLQHALWKRLWKRICKYYTDLHRDYNLYSLYLWPRFQAFSFQCTFVPGSEKTIEGTFAPVELSFHGTFAPGNFRSFSFLGSEGSKNFRSVEHLLSWNFRSSGANVPRTFVPMKLSYHENEYFENFRSKCPKTRPINLTIAYAH